MEAAQTGRQRWWWLALGIGAFLILAGTVIGVRWALRNFGGADTAFRAAPVAIEAVLNTTEMPLQLTVGFSIGLFATGLTSPRVIVVDDLGTALVSDMGAGKVLALPDADHNGQADRSVVLAEGLIRPHGLALRCAARCELYLAESNRLSVWQYDPAALALTGRRDLLELPDDGNHFTKSLLFLPPPHDNELLLAMGSTCNVCDEEDPRRATISRVSLDQPGLAPYATGLRNAVFLTSHPETQEVWVTEMGRDRLGDDLPPDEINVLKEGADYGWPECYGNQVRDQSFSAAGPDPCATSEPSFIDLQAHSAPLGLAFIPLDSPWPAEYRGDLLVALHGSWNRTVPTGYAIWRIDFDAAGEILGQEALISGWLTPDERSLGRPVGLAFDQAGGLLITDDKAGVVYRVLPPATEL
jgi:glucose/arabinose dehydrogenase